MGRYEKGQVLRLHNSALEGYISAISKSMIDRKSVISNVFVKLGSPEEYVTVIFEKKTSRGKNFEKTFRASEIDGLIKQSEVYFNNDLAQQAAINR